MCMHNCLSRRSCGEFCAYTYNIICKIARLVKLENASAFLVHVHTLWIVERLKRHKTYAPSIFQENVSFFQQVQNLQYKMCEIFYLNVFERIRET